MEIKVDNTTITVKAPGNKDLQDAQMEYSIKMAELMRAEKKLMSRSELARYMRDHKFWTSEDQDLMDLLQRQLRDLEKRLAEGGMTVEEGKSVTIQMRYSRSILMALTNKKTQMDNITMESVAENHRFKFLMTRCIKDEKGAAILKTVAECDARQDDPIVIEGAAALNSIIYDYDPKFLDKLPENQWLHKYGFVNKDGKLSDADGKPVSIDGKFINDDGRYVSEDGELVDIDGNRVDEEGRFIIEDPKPFFDDNGDPVGVATKKKKKKKKTTKKSNTEKV